MARSSALLPPVDTRAATSATCSGTSFPRNCSFSAYPARTRAASSSAFSKPMIAAIEVLAVTRREDPRYSTAMENIVHALVNNDHRHSRSSAVAGLSELAGDQQLPANVLAVLTKTATTDPYMTVRMDALELLATQEIDQTRSGDLSASLAAEIIRPSRCMATTTS